MGTPHFAVPSLVALLEHHQVVGIVTQPDRPAGRGRNVSPSPVKEAAVARGLPILQPPKLRSPEARDWLATMRPDVIVVAAFGQILQPALLELPAHGCLNVHASLLPRYRGAAPIPAAILAGDLTTGVTIMRMDPGMDTGPILAQAGLPIAPHDTTATLTDRLADLGARLLVNTLSDWLAGHVPAQPQNPAQATYCRPLDKKDGLLDWTRPAVHLDRQVRACDPWPGAYTTWKGNIFKVLRARPRPELEGKGDPGQVVALPGAVGVVTGQGLLELLEVRLAGKKSMTAEVFVRGQHGMAEGKLGGG